MTRSQKIFAAILILLGILCIGIGIYIVIRVSQEPPKELAIDRPRTPTTTLIPTEEEQGNIIPASLEGLFSTTNSLIREYNLSVKSKSTINPLPDIVLLIQPKNNNQNEQIILEIAPSLEPLYDNLSQKWTYKFVWEAPSANSSLLSINNLIFSLKSSKFGTIDAPLYCANCENFISVSDEIPTNPIFTVTKTSTITCSQNGDALMEFKIRVRNISAQNSTFKTLEDSLDPLFNGSPLSISPSANVQNKKISWNGQNFTFSPNQVIEFKYSINIPKDDVNIYPNSTYKNTVKLTYGNNSSTTYNLFTKIGVCSINITPTTTPTPTLTPTSAPTQFVTLTVTPTAMLTPTPTPAVTEIPRTSVYFTNQKIPTILFG
ncbi:MAG: hypothetical protein NZZ41_03595, partial [Candidatus Dojkabacteria bacterium]|nr:hypothetical protein [Candidatus Dojkabacteria bacterium]